MINIVNGFSFKRNFDNTVFISLSTLAHALGVQPYLVKEHYYICVADRCFSDGEVHEEEIENSKIEVYIPCKSLEYLIDSLRIEKVAITSPEVSSTASMVIRKMLETQRIVSECFDIDPYDYKDPIRKINSDIPDISKSVSNIDENKTKLSYKRTPLN